MKQLESNDIDGDPINTDDWYVRLHSNIIFEFTYTPRQTVEYFGEHEHYFRLV